MGNTSTTTIILAVLLSIPPAALSFAPRSPRLLHRAQPRCWHATVAAARTLLGTPSPRRVRPVASMSAGRDACPAPPNPAADVCVRVLCLHGKGGNGPQFVDASLLPLRSLVANRFADQATIERFGGRKVSFQWEALTAPYELTPGDAAGGYSWWTMPPGVRSYNAKEYEGFDKSAAMVMEKIFTTEDEDPAKTCNFDIVLGHSQGAILTAALLSTEDVLWQAPGPRPSGYVLNGAAWPNPYDEALSSLAERTPDAQESPPRLLFIMGEHDRINPPESAAQVREAYRAAGCDVATVSHGGGHAVPSGWEEGSAEALEAVVDWIASIAEEKARLAGDVGRTPKDTPLSDDGSATVFVYGTLKRDFFNYDKWIKPFLLQESDGSTVEQFVATHCQSQPSHCDEDDASGIDPDGERRDEGPIYDDAVATQKRMEEILASGPKAFLLTEQARTAEDTSISLYADKFFVPYAVLKPAATEDAPAPLRGELYRVNAPMLGLLDELEGVRGGRYARSEIAVTIAAATPETAFLYHYCGATEGLERIAEYGLARHREQYVPPLERT